MRETIYSNLYRYQGHSCSTLLLRCIDARFHEALETVLPRWLMEIGGERRFFSAGLPGGSKAVLEPETQSVLFQMLDLAVGELGVTRLVIADHIDCRGYGGSELHAGPVEEAEFHCDQLRQARQAVRDAYPGLEVVLVYEDWQRIREVE